MALNEYGQIVQNEIINTAKIRDNIIIDQYIIMPNHIHLIIHIVGATRWVARTNDNARTLETTRTNDNAPNCINARTVDNNITNPGTETAPNCQSTTAPETGLHKSTLESGTIGAIIGQIKSISTKKSRLINPNGFLGNYDKNMCGSDITDHKTVDVHGIGRPTGSPLRWQRNYYEHIIRNEKSYQIIAEYIKTNPEKWTTDKFFRE